MLRNILIALGILFTIFLLFFIGSGLLIFSAFGGFDKDYSVSELKENFNKKEVEIYKLRNFFKEKVPKGKFVEIEFDNNNTLGRLGITQLGDSNQMIFSEWDLEINTERTDSIIRPLGWTRETLKTLKKKLDKANCIGIESGDPTKIRFQRSGLGMYSFNIFDSPIPDSLRQCYNDSCRYILVNDRLALEYGGGAIGAQCFYNKK